MDRPVVNGFKMTTPQDTFPARHGNMITYECFRLWGGLENPKLSKISHYNGDDLIYFSYHDISKRG